MEDPLYRIQFVESLTSPFKLLLKFMLLCIQTNPMNKSVVLYNMKRNSRISRTDKYYTTALNTSLHGHHLRTHQFLESSALARNESSLSCLSFFLIFFPVMSYPICSSSLYHTRGTSPTVLRGATCFGINRLICIKPRGRKQYYPAKGTKKVKCPHGKFKMNLFVIHLRTMTA